MVIFQQKIFPQHSVHGTVKIRASLDFHPILVNKAFILFAMKHNNKREGGGEKKETLSFYEKESWMGLNAAITAQPVHKEPCN